MHGLLGVLLLLVKCLQNKVIRRRELRFGDAKFEQTGDHVCEAACAVSEPAR